MSLDCQTRVFVAVPAGPEAAGFGPALAGEAVAVADWVVQQDLFTSAPAFSFNLEFRESPLGTPHLTREVPGLSPRQRDKLDQRGIVPLGSEVCRGDVLVGKTAPRGKSELSLKDQLLHAVFGHAGPDVYDDSLYYEFGDPGKVSAVNLSGRWRYHCARCGDMGLFGEGSACPYCQGPLTGPQRDDLPPGIVFQVAVEVIVRRPLRVGDVLETENGCQVVVARIVPREAMPTVDGQPVAVWARHDSQLAAQLAQSGWLEYPGRSGLPDIARHAVLSMKKTTLRLEDKLLARGRDEGYSLISQMPLAGSTAPRPAQRVSRATSLALLRAGYRRNLMEMLTIKSDAVEGRTHAYEALLKGEPVKPAVPETAHRLILLLRALGLSLVFRGSWGEEVSLEDGRSYDDLTLEIQGASEREVRLWSFGAVKNAVTINYRTYRPEKDGLFCERIFGPERNWECVCGKYRGMKYKGMICDRCGVKVTHSRVRRKRMGHIELAAPVVHPWFLPAVADRLGVDLASLTRVVHHQEHVVTNPGRALALRLEQRLTDEELEAARKEYGAAAFTADTGAAAVRELLGARCLDRLSWVVLDAVAVLPPDLRPLVLLDSGNFATSDLNDLYRRLINRNNRLAKLIDLGAPDHILRNEKRQLQEAIDALFDNGRCRRPVRGSNNRPLVSLADNLVIAVAQLDEKPTDFSARGVVIPDAELAPKTIGLPDAMVRELYAPLAVKPLLVAGQAGTLQAARHLLAEESLSPAAERALQAALARHPVLAVGDGQCLAALRPIWVKGEAVHLHPEDARRLGLTFAGDGVILHVALSDEAEAELSAPRPCPDTSSVLTGLGRKELVERVLQGSALPLTALDRIVLGIEDAR